ncbi:hypothetical protein [Streptomyces sp. NPDC089915]|uniref:hypothetical protein n=1 Tax=Streptomyces sp. NPDC089915 TaxID=3155186 RepID=UPI003435AFCC
MSQSHAPQTRWIARHRLLTGSGALLALVALTACTGGEAGGGANSPKPQKSAAAGAPAPASPSQGGKTAAIRGNGTVQVGSDVKPGTYRSTGNKSGCYWERAKDASGDTDSITANDNVEGTAYVTLTASDKVFKSTGCKDWEAVDPKASGGSPKAEAPGNGGMFKVGTDIAPGTYKSAGPAKGGFGCYWERAKDAEHQSESIEANDNPTGPAVVTVSADDAYFKTTGCADWKKS